MIKRNKKLERLIDTSIRIDQGDCYKRALKKYIHEIKDAYKPKEDKHEKRHLGASIIGKPCLRAGYYAFREFKKANFDGRVLRLFNRGHLEEARVMAALHVSGVTVKHLFDDDKQQRFSKLGGHFGGSGDGEVNNVRGYEGLTMLLEIKTYNDSSFNALKRNGLLKTNYAHIVQTNIYMAFMGYSKCLYVAVNKNNDEMHILVINYSANIARTYYNKAKHIIKAKIPPKRCSQSETFFLCKFCDYRDICFNNAPADIHCLSCVHSKAINKGKFKCSLRSKLLEPRTDYSCKRYKMVKG